MARAERLFHRGFTLIELMIVLGIAAILATIAYPAYSHVVHKVRRSDAQVALMALHMKQERHRADHASYASLSEIGMASGSPSRHYVLSIVSNTESGFDARAVATGAQAEDAACRHMRLAVEGMNVVHGSGPDARMGNPPAQNKQCWGL